MSNCEIRNIVGQKFEDLKEPNKIPREVNPDYWNEWFKKDLQRKIWDFNTKNERFDLDKLLNYARNELDYTGSRATLWRILKSMGYKFKVVNKRKILCESSHVLKAKLKFLKKYLEYKNSGTDVCFIFLDETWVYQNGSQVRQWCHDTDLKSNPSKIKPEGKRFTILHAGSKLGFLSGCDLLLDSDNNDRDYHKTMNGDLFKKWVENQLIPALSKLNSKCVVVMDNAPYHSVVIDKPPNFSANKKTMQDWLTNHNVVWEQNFTKKQLWDLILPFRQTNYKYVIDELLKTHGHDVLRLPPYHCQYNPIELAWGVTKTFYNKYIFSGQNATNRQRVTDVWQEALSTCTSDMWVNFIKHCDKIIQDDWTKYMGHLTLDNIPPVIVSITEDPDTDSDTDMEFE